jgi:hypothetical protein
LSLIKILALKNKLDEFIKKYINYKTLRVTNFEEFRKDEENINFLSLYNDIDRYIRSKYRIKSPTYKESLQYGNTVAILDIAIAHKGMIKYGIEIYNTNPVTEEKIEKLYKLGLENLIELDAKWILRQTGKPDVIKVKRWLIKDYVLIKQF